MGSGPFPSCVKIGHWNQSSTVLQECPLWVVTSTGRCNILNSDYTEGDVEHEDATEDLLQRNPEGLDVGSLAAGRFTT